MTVRPVRQSQNLHNIPVDDLKHLKGFILEILQDWKHGAVLVNGFNIGRYYTVGPQKTLYIPGPLLHKGTNEIIVFENYLGSDTFKFTNAPNYGNPSSDSELRIQNEFQNAH